MEDCITVRVKTTYLPEQSDAKRSRFVFGYTITIQNNGDSDMQLISRHWIITDANSDVQEVRGVGVVGEQPQLAPGEEYTYSSGVILPTDTGTMTGSYQMRSALGEEFDAPIPKFTLIPPHKLH